MGIGLVLVGAFLPRITSIKIAGQELGLSPLAQVELAKAVAKRVSDPDEVEVAYFAAKGQLLSLGSLPTVEEIDMIAADVVRKIRPRDS